MTECRLQTEDEESQATASRNADCRPVSDRRVEDLRSCSVVEFTTTFYLDFDKFMAYHKLCKAIRGDKYDLTRVDFFKL